MFPWFQKENIPTLFVKKVNRALPEVSETLDSVLNLPYVSSCEKGDSTKLSDSSLVSHRG